MNVEREVKVLNEILLEGLNGKNRFSCLDEYLRHKGVIMRKERVKAIEYSTDEKKQEVTIIAESRACEW